MVGCHWRAGGGRASYDGGEWYKRIMDKGGLGRVFERQYRHGAL